MPLRQIVEGMAAPGQGIGQVIVPIQGKFLEDRLDGGIFRELFFIDPGEQQAASESSSDAMNFWKYGFTRMESYRLRMKIS